MNTLSNIQFTWMTFLIVVLVLALTYLALKLLERVIYNVQLPKELFSTISSILNFVLLLFEPFSMLILVCLFLFINPALHAVFLLFFSVFNYGHIKNYTLGFFIRTDRNITIPNQIKSGNLQGAISEINRRFLKLKSDEGLHTLPYSILFDQGYTIITGTNSGSIHQLFITKEGDAKKTREAAKQLKDLLVEAPYIDWKYEVEILPEIKEDRIFLKTFIPVKDKSHIFELIDLLKESGYGCQLVK